MGEAVGAWAARVLAAVRRHPWRWLLAVGFFGGVGVGFGAALVGPAPQLAAVPQSGER